MKSEAEQGPGDLLNLGLSFWRGKALLSAVELGVFGALADRSLDAEELSEELGLHPRAAQDFFDVLVALKLLRRTDGRYENSVDAERYLVPKRATYIGGALEMANARLYGTWGKLTDALRTGLPQ